MFWNLVIPLRPVNIFKPNNILGYKKKLTWVLLNQKCTYKNKMLHKRANVWNGPVCDKVGIEFTGSQQDPNFLPSLAPTNHPSVLVDISIFFDLKEIKEKL